MEGALPASAIDRLQPLPALLHALEPVALLLCCRGQVVLQGGPPPLPVDALVFLLLGHVVVMQEIVIQMDRDALWVFFRAPLLHVYAGRLEDRLI